MSIETPFALFNLPADTVLDRPTPQEYVKGVAVDLAVATVALKALVELSGKSNQALGANEASEAPDLRQKMAKSIPEERLDFVVGLMQHNVLPESTEEDKVEDVDPRIMRHLSVLTRPAALKNAGFAPRAVDKMTVDTLNSLNSTIGTGVKASERVKKLRQVKKLVSE